MISTEDPVLLNSIGILLAVTVISSSMIELLLSYSLTNFCISNSFANAANEKLIIKGIEYLRFFIEVFFIFPLIF